MQVTSQVFSFEFDTICGLIVFVMVNSRHSVHVTMFVCCLDCSVHQDPDGFFPFHN